MSNLIGCLVWAWNEDKKEKILGILTEIKDGPYKYHIVTNLIGNQGRYYRECEAVKPSQIIFAEDNIVTSESENGDAFIRNSLSAENNKLKDKIKLIERENEIFRVQISASKNENRVLRENIVSLNGCLNKEIR